MNPNPSAQPSTTNWPERIFLQHGESELPPFNELAGITWSSDNVNGNDVEYVRADSLVKVTAERDGLVDDILEVERLQRELATARRDTLELAIATVRESIEVLIPNGDLNAADQHFTHGLIAAKVQATNYLRAILEPTNVTT